MTAADGAPALRTCLVVGAGLIGTSVALALRRHGVAVHLTDRDPAAARAAADLGAGRLEPPASQVDLAVVAVSPAATVEVVSGLLAGNVAATVVDTCGVKAAVVAGVRAAVGPAPHFVGTHPMAGRERSGPLAARADLFQGRPWAVSVADADPRSVARAHLLVELCGAVRVELDPVAHDAAVALVSHVPQVAASLVAARLADGPPSAMSLVGPGVRDVTRVAASDPDLWVEVLLANADPVARVLAHLRRDLDAVLDALAGAPDPEAARSALRAVLRRGNAGRARLPGKHGGQSTPYAVVPVVLPDRPGQLGRLFADVGRAGTNIEDVRIEHAPGQPVGLVELAVAPDAAGVLVAELARLGWAVQAEPT